MNELEKRPTHQVRDLMHNEDDIEDFGMWLAYQGTEKECYNFVADQGGFGYKVEEIIYCKEIRL